MADVDISHFSKAEALRRLYNAAKSHGLGLRRATADDMTLEEAEKYVHAGDDHLQMFGTGSPLYFDYLNGRVLKVDLSGDSFDPCLYDRDNGEGAAQRAIGPAPQSNLDWALDED